MPGLSSAALLARVKAALPTGSVVVGGTADLHPLTADVAGAQGAGRWLLYVWTVTPDRSDEGRPAGEYKIQLQFSQASAAVHRLPGSPTGARARYGLQLAPGTATALLGYSPEFGVFVAWEARLYPNFGSSPNVQVREDLLDEARRYGWAVAEPRRRKQDEVRVAFGSAHLARYLAASQASDAAGRFGRARLYDMLAATPLGPAAENGTPAPLTPAAAALPLAVANQRQRIAATRLLRDPRFAHEVKEAYDHACAACGLQLNVVEAAHIIPASEPAGTDDVWNGVTLCPTHHTLFDARAFVVRQSLKIAVDQDLVAFLPEIGRDGGLGVLTSLDGVALRRPTFWGDPPARTAMLQALAHRETAAGY